MIKKLKQLLFLSLLISIASCKKSEDSAKLSGTFTITKASGSTISTKYVNTPIPNSNGHFSLQYQPNGNGARYMFFVLVDSRNNGGLDFSTSSAVQNGVTYTTNVNLGREVDFYGDFFNAEVDDPYNYGRTEIIFESSSYPGKIVGSFKKYNAAGAITFTGSFNFTAE